MANNTFTKFNTLSDMVKHVKDLPHREENHYDYGGSEGDDWFGGSWDDAYRLVERGWAEGAAQASAMSVSIADRAIQGTSASMHTDVVHDVCGAAYDPGAYMSGVPECWIAFQPREDKRGIRIVVNIAVSCGVSAEIFRRRGIALSALALALNAQGHPVTIDVIQAIKPRDGGWRSEARDYETVQFRVADAMSGSIIDVDRVVYALAHPTVFRRFTAAVTNGYRGRTAGTRWGSSQVPYIGEEIPDLGDYDLFLGAGHIDDVESWIDGGESWVLEEYIRQTEKKV